MYFGTAHQNPRILILFINLKTGTIIIQWDNGGGGGEGESGGKGEKGGKHREVGERVTGSGSR